MMSSWMGSVVVTGCWYGGGPIGGSPIRVTGVVGRWRGSVVVQTIGIYVNVTMKKEDV